MPQGSLYIYNSPLHPQLKLSFLELKKSMLHYSRLIIFSSLHTRHEILALTSTNVERRSARQEKSLRVSLAHISCLFSKEHDKHEEREDHEAPENQEERDAKNPKDPKVAKNPKITENVLSSTNVTNTENTKASY